MLVLWVEFDQCGWFVESRCLVLNLVNYLDIVVVGIVVDVVVFDQNNCILVYQGLQCICVGCCWLGIIVMLDVV